MADYRQIVRNSSINLLFPEFARCSFYIFFEYPEKEVFIRVATAPGDFLDRQIALKQKMLCIVQPPHRDKLFRQHPELPNEQCGQFRTAEMRPCSKLGDRNFMSDVRINILNQTKQLHFR